MGWYEPTRRREVKGGVKAQSKSSVFGTSWWAKRWIAVLESLNIGSRLARGRSYARSGQVISIDIESGVVSAKVQGSRATPYRVSIKVATIAEKDWITVAESLAGQVLYAAKLMAGEMPDTIEQAFKSVGFSLFPSSLREITTDCTCPDWSNPCKHVAAVYYLLGEEFDRDPFLMFRLRGKSRDAFLALLGPQTKGPSGESTPVPQPLKAAEFWRKEAMLTEVFGDVNIPPVAAALPRRLGSFPFWRGDEPLQQQLDPYYSEASQRSLRVFVGEVDAE